MNLFEDFIGYQGSAVLDEPEQKTDTISVPILQCEEPENAEKFTSASLICKVFYGKMKAQWGKYTLLLNLL